MTRLQGVLNRAARLILGISFRDRITPALIQLHWLPIKARIIYKICVITYQTLNTNYTGQPEYLRDLLLNFYIPSTIQIRHSFDEFRLIEPRARTHWGVRTFSHCAPRLHNRLTSDVKSSTNVAIFKKRLKTYLFVQCYNLES